MEWCKKCNSPIFDFDEKKHTCPPVFKIICDEYDPDDEHEVYATDYAEAVELWAEWYDSEDTPTIAADNDTMVVRVRRFDEHTWKTYKVTGEFRAHYNAEPVK